MSTADIGTTLHIATGVPATFDKAGYEALTWVKVGGIQSIGQIGETNATIEVPDLETGRTQIKKGAGTGTTIDITIREIAADAGQVALKAACATDERAEFSFKASEPDGGPVEYWSGVAMSFTRTERSTTSYAGFTAQTVNNYGSVNATAPA